jgi:hypothetical protein
MNTSLPLYWRLPLVGNNDEAIDQASKEYIARKQVYTLGGLLAYLRWRVPTLRIELAATAAAKRRRAHDAKVHELIKPRIAA